LKLELPRALEERIAELVRSGFYNSAEEFITEAVRLHLQNQKFKELERLSEKWVNNSIYRLPYWPDYVPDTTMWYK
jgi:Arc/MetJ-type ribon-helix-helix transcriptional regulator